MKIGDYIKRINSGAIYKIIDVDSHSIHLSIKYICESDGSQSGREEGPTGRIRRAIAEKSYELYDYKDLEKRINFLNEFKTYFLNEQI